MGCRSTCLERWGDAGAGTCPTTWTPPGPTSWWSWTGALVDRGDLIAIRVDAVEPTKEVSVYAAPFGELQHLLEPMDETETRFGGDLLVPDDAPLGWFELVVVARDKAGNRTEQRLELMVVE
jgi:hypothetical protein